MIILGTRCCSIPISSIAASASTPGMVYTVSPDSLVVTYMANDTYTSGEKRNEVKPFIVGPSTASRNFPPNFDTTHYMPVTNSLEYGVINTKTGVEGVLDDGVTTTKLVV